MEKKKRAMRRMRKPRGKINSLNINIGLDSSHGT